MQKFPRVIAVSTVLLLCNNLLSQVITVPAYSKPSEDQFQIHEGILSIHKQTIILKEGRKKVARIKLGEPIIVAIADEPEKWGYFQFPSIFRTEDRTLLICWQMRADSYKAYGKKNSGKNKMMSRDNGETWIDYDGRFDTEWYFYNILNGKEYMSIYVPSPTIISNINSFPNPIDAIEDYGEKYTFYRNSDLPEDLKGIYVRKWTDRHANARQITTIHANFNDKELCRYATDDQMSVLWSGDIKTLRNSDIIGSTYRGFYCNEKGNVLPSGISFYKWNEESVSWDILGKIPFQPDSVAEPQGQDRRVWGFTEPTFEEMENGVLVCVMRSSYQENLGPMYKSKSIDGGRTWSKPCPFTPNGVKPHFLKLGNGTLVLSSGRPGVQLRFNLDGSGEKWTEPIEMLSFMKDDGGYNREVSCGYTDLLPIDDNTFFVVYSDFFEHNQKGEQRKAIKIRKIAVYNYN